MIVRPDSQLGFRQTMDGQTDRQKETDITKERLRTCHVVTYMRESSSYEVYETILSDTVYFRLGKCCHNGPVMRRLWHYAQLYMV